MPLDLDHQEVQDAPIENGDEAGYPGDYSDDANGRFVIINNADEGRQDDDGQTRTLRSLHPYTRPLTVSDLDSCIALENAAFAENERCSPDKVSWFLYVTCRSYSSPLLPLRRCSATYLLYYLPRQRPIIIVWKIPVLYFVVEVLGGGVDPMSLEACRYPNIS